MGKRVEGGRVRREERMNVLRVGRGGRGAFARVVEEVRVVMKSFRAVMEGSVLDLGSSFARSLSSGGTLL